jgi:hypothetical protein
LWLQGAIATVYQNLLSTYCKCLNCNGPNPNFCCQYNLFACNLGSSYGNLITLLVDSLSATTAAIFANFINITFQTFCQDYTRFKLTVDCQCGNVKQKCNPCKGRKDDEEDEDSDDDASTQSSRQAKRGRSNRR